MSNQKVFEGRVALVTGCGSASGIGFATARMLAMQGAKVAITSTTGRIKDRARELKAACAADSLALTADLCDRARIKSLIKRVLSRFHRLDIVVNNAGMTQIGNPMGTALQRFERMTEKQWDYGIAINLKTCFNVTQAALPAMLKQNYGRIVNVASTTGPVGSNPGETPYSAAKAAIVGLTRGLALEVASSRITVNAVAPGWIETESSTPVELVAAKHTPIGRAGSPSEVAAVIAFLSSESASYITGQMIVIDGGNSVQEYKGPADQGQRFTHGQKSPFRPQDLPRYHR